MNYLSVEGLSKSYGVKALFDNISFGIDKGQKVALVAKNGTGKSSLLRILAGKDIPDKGKVTLRKEISVGYLEQDPQFNLKSTIADSIFSFGGQALAAIKEYESALEQSETDFSETSQERFQNAIEQMEHHNAWDYEVKVKQVLSKLNIHDLTKTIESLSGGQRKRVALARLLVHEHDLLIMDEPTNHLDLEMIEWLESYFIRNDVSLLLVTHDRYFLDRVCNEIIEIDNSTLYKYKGNYSYFVEKKAEREFNEGREVDKARNLFKKELEWVRRMPKARGTKAKSRVDAFEEIKEKAAGKKQQDKLQLDVKMSRVGGKILELKKVYKSYGDKEIIKGFDYTFKTGERIGIVGKNGVGKSTFLNLITGLEQPDSGKINTGDTIVYGYYSQHGLKLNEDKRVIEVVKDIAEVIPQADGSKITASQFLQLFQFPPEVQYTFVSKLSGGERRRLFLLTVLIKNPNFLILDEPTNDLDLLTLSILEDFLMNFKGCLIVVSHDRYFMDKLVDHLFIFEGEGVIRDFNGTYEDYRSHLAENEKQNRADEKALLKQETVKAPEPEPEAPGTRKLSFKEKFEYEELEKEIAILEKEKQILNEKLASLSDHRELQETSGKLTKVIQQIEEKTMRWLELSELL